MADAYIVVLDVTADAVRALLFDSEARRVEGYAAQLPRRADAAADCLDEMHRLVQAAGFRVAAVAGRAESEVTPEDRAAWPGFAGAAWFPALAEGAGVMLGSGCVSSQSLALVMGDAGMLGTVVERQISVDGLTCLPIDEKRWMVSGAVPEAGLGYTSLRRAIKGSVEKYLVDAAADDPLLAGIDAAARRFAEIYRTLVGDSAAPQVIACGAALLKSPALTQRIADAVGVALTLSTEPEAGCRGSALWALERIGAIGELGALPASMGPVVEPKVGVTASDGRGSV